MTRVSVQATRTARERARKSTTFPREEKGIDIEAAVLMNALCKPWELGGHPHDFYVAHRSARITDATQYYERDTENIKATKDMANGIRELSFMMPSKFPMDDKVEPYSVCIAGIFATSQEPTYAFTVDTVRIKSYNAGDDSIAKALKSDRPIYEHDVAANLQILSSSFVDDKIFPKYSDVYPPHRSSSTVGHSLSPIQQVTDAPRHPLMSPLTVAEKKAVEDLDAFEVQTMAPPKQKQTGAPGSALSFGKGKRH